MSALLDPVASPKNVTETLAPGTCPNQRQFRQSVRLCEGLSSPGVNQFFGHDAAPLFHSALHGSQLHLAETARMLRLQLGHQRLAGSIRFGMQPDQHVAPNTLEGILAGPPVPGTSDPSRMSESDLTGDYIHGYTAAGNGFNSRDSAGLICLTTQPTVNSAIPSPDI